MVLRELTTVDRKRRSFGRARAGHRGHSPFRSELPVNSMSRVAVLLLLAWGAALSSSALPEGPVRRSGFARDWGSPAGLPGPPGLGNPPRYYGGGTSDGTWQGSPGIASCPSCRHKCYTLDVNCKCVFDVVCGFRHGIMPTFPPLPPPKYLQTTTSPPEVRPTLPPTTTHLPRPTIIGFPTRGCPGKCQVRNRVGTCEVDSICLFGGTTSGPLTVPREPTALPPPGSGSSDSSGDTQAQAANSASCATLRRR